MNKQVVGGIVTALIGLYGASWAWYKPVILWWAFPTVLTGTLMAIVGTVVGVISVIKKLVDSE